MKHPIKISLWLPLCLFVLVGCNNPQTHTIVTLHVKKAQDLKEVIRESLGDKIKFSTTENQVIIFAQKKDIKPTLNLLKALDQWPSFFVVTLKSEKKHQYSTIKSPVSFSLQSERDTLIKINNTELVFRVKQISRDQPLLKIKSLEAGHVIEQHILLTDRVWLKAKLLSLDYYPWIKIEIKKSK